MVIAALKDYKERIRQKIERKAASAVEKWFLCIKREWNRISPPIERVKAIESGGEGKRGTAELLVVRASLNALSNETIYK